MQHRFHLRRRGRRRGRRTERGQRHLPTVWGSESENSDAISQNYDIPEYMDRAEEFQSKDSETDPVGRMVVAM